MQKGRIVYGCDVNRFEMDFIPSYMIRIVQNLLSNAIKFSYPGSNILVSVKILDTEDGQALQLYVCDTGVGMTKEQKDKIFTPFYQAHDDTANIGSGVGLSLVKLTAEAMGGNIEVHSYLSEGSVFIVTIPIIDAGPGTEMIDHTEYTLDFSDRFNTYELEDQANDNTDAPRILIVEDTPDVARWQMRQLNPEYSFYFASDGEEGLRKAEEIVPDLIITDVMMPVMDGYTLCRNIRESELLCHVPIIMVTAKATVEDKIMGLESGADAYIEKPFHPGELSTRVTKLLEQRAMLRRVFTEGMEAQEPAAQHEMSVSDRMFVDRLSAVINDHIVKGKIDYDELAAAFYVGKTQLNRKIKAITGYTTTEYILQVRISLAKQFLAKTDYSVGEVASRVGIDDVAYFSSVFRKMTGMTPTSFRNR
jgi:DNA-binding response OmpR family regulator